MPAFTGALLANEIFATNYNMILSQQVLEPNVKHLNDKLISRNKVDGGLYGDQKLYYDADVLQSYAWGNDAEAANLLTNYRPEDPECQAIELDTFRQIPLTVDRYLTKRMWMTEGAFSQFNDIMLGMMADTKKVYESTLFNAYIGTYSTSTGEQDQTITLVDPVAEGEGADPTNAEIEATNRINAELIAEKIANLMVEMGDYSRSFNDYGHLKAFTPDELTIVWNAAWANKLKKVDMPTLFHKEGLIDKFEEAVLPARYFGTVNASATAGDGSTVRSLIEQELTHTPAGGTAVTTHYFPGDLIDAADTAGAGTSYTVDEDIICKIIAKENAVPVMSAFEVGTSFFNAKSLTENHYLTFGHNTLEALKAKPFVTLTAV